MMRRTAGAASREILYTRRIDRSLRLVPDMRVVKLDRHANANDSPIKLRHGLALSAVAAGCVKTRPPAAVAAKPTAVRQAFVGDGVEVTLDVAGWRPPPGAGSLGYHAERLAVLDRDRAEQVSIEIDDLPDGLFMTLADLLKYGL